MAHSDEVAPRDGITGQAAVARPLKSASVSILAETTALTVGTAALAAIWRVLVKDGRPGPEEWNLGFDLLVAAIALEFQFIWEPQVPTQSDVGPNVDVTSVRLAIIIALLLLTLALAVGVRQWGYTGPSGQVTLRKGAAWTVTSVGVVALALAYVLGTYSVAIGLEAR
jgi:hypothetical protein